MKKRLLFLTVLAMALVCLLAFSVSADSINPSTSDAYGTPTTFDEAIGRTDISQNKADGTVAYTVLYDGTSDYYTVPTTYLLSKNQYNSGVLQFDFSAISTKLDKSFSRTSVIRCELPDAITSIGPNENNYPQCFQGFSNVVEIKLSSSISFAGSGQYKAFANCKNLVEIDLSNVNFNYPNSTYSLLEYCENLERVTLPDAYEKDGAPVDYAINYMFNGCKNLEIIKNYNNFFKGVTIVGEKAFMECHKLHNIELWNGITKIESRAFQSCYVMTKFIIPNTCTTIGTTETVFASCTSLAKVVFPSGTVSVGAYAFEKCKALTDVWMPGAGSTFAAQVFGQCGSSRAVNFYFTTAESTITFSNAENKDDPFVTALNTENDTRIKYNTPLSTKCTVFLGGHTGGDKAVCTDGIKCARCTIELLAKQENHVITVTIEYPNGIAVVGKKVTSACENDYCTLASVEEDAPVIVTALGYSYREDGKSGLCGGFEIDQVALKAYKDANPTKAVTLSILIANPNNLDQDVLINAQGAYVLAENVTKGAVQVDITNSTFRTIEYKVTGFSLDNMKNLELCFAVVVKDDSKVYTVQSQANEAGGKSVKNTYTAGDITLCSVTVQSIAPDFVAGLEQPVE